MESGSATHSAARTVWSRESYWRSSRCSHAVAARFAAHFGSQAWIAHPIIDTPERTPEQKFEWKDLRGQARAAIEVHDLDPDLDPSGSWYSYSRTEQSDGDVQARADIITGATCHRDLVSEFFDPKRRDELAGSGACFAYLMFPSDELARGEEVDQRVQVQDALIEAMWENESGLVIGGAMGRQYAYIDLILFDEVRAIEAMSRVVPNFAFVTAATLRYFAAERENEFKSLPG